MSNSFAANSLRIITEVKSKLVNILHNTYNDFCKEDELIYLINVMDWILLGKIFLDEEIIDCLLDQIVIDCVCSKDLEILEIVNLLKTLKEKHYVKI